MECAKGHQASEFSSLKDPKVKEELQGVFERTNYDGECWVILGYVECKYRDWFDENDFKISKHLKAKRRKHR